MASTTASVAATATSDVVRETSTGQVLVSFFTTTSPYVMPEQTYAVPLSILPEGLNRLVQSVLGVEGRTFDFLHEDDYIRGSLLRFLQRRGIDYERVLHVEYTPALEAKDGALLPHDDWVSAVRAPLAGDAELLWTASYDHVVRLWQGDRCLALGTCHTEAVKDIALHPSRPDAPRGGPPAAADDVRARKRLRAALPADLQCLSAGKDGRLAAWQVDAATATMTCLGHLEAHTSAVEAVHVAPHGADLVASAGWDATVKVFAWDDVVRGGAAPLVTFTDQTRPVMACRFSEAHGAAQLYAAGLDGPVVCLDVERAERCLHFPGDHALYGLDVRPATASADLVLAAATDHRARLFDTRQRTTVATFGGHRQWLYAVAWLWRREETTRTTPGDRFATAGEDGVVRVFDLRCTSTPLLVLDTLHTDGVLDVTYVGQSLLASGGKDNRIKTVSLDEAVA